MFFALIRRCLLVAIAEPQAAFRAGKLGDAIEKSRGPNHGTRLPRSGGNTLQDRFGRRKAPTIRRRAMNPPP